MSSLPNAAADPRRSRAGVKEWLIRGAMLVAGFLLIWLFYPTAFWLLGKSSPSTLFGLIFSPGKLLAAMLTVLALVLAGFVLTLLIRRPRLAGMFLGGTLAAGFLAWGPLQLYLAPPAVAQTESCPGAPAAFEVGRELSHSPGVSIRFCGRERTFGTPASISILGPDQNRICKLEAESKGLRDIVSWTCPYNLGLWDEASLPEGFYSISARTKGDKDALWKLVAPALEEAFAIRIARGRREVDAYVLSCPGDRRPVALKAPSPGAGYHSSLKGWEFRRTDMVFLADFLGQKLQAPVLDETRLKGAFDFELEGSPFEPERLEADVEKLGLKLTRAKRTIELLVIEKAVTGQPKAPEPDTVRKGKRR